MRRATRGLFGDLDALPAVRSALTDAAVNDAGLVIFAAGVRPRDELATAAGLTHAERGGVLTDMFCQTSDPNIDAIGVVAANDGRCYSPGGNLSAPVYAARITGDGIVAVART